MLTSPIARTRRLASGPILLFTLLLALLWPVAGTAQIGLTDDRAGEEESAQLGTTIPVDGLDGPHNEAIAVRIRTLFEPVKALAGIRVEVRGGIVTLSGTVSTQQDKERAVALAERVEGVVMVMDDLATDLTVQTRFGATVDSLQGELKAFLSLLPVLLVAAVIVAIFTLVARLAGKANGLYERITSNTFLRDLLRQVVQIGIFLFGVVIALMVLDATALIGSLAGALGILGLAIGFATRDTVENYIASILLSLRQPFRHEDFVGIDDIEGKVLRLTSRATVLMSVDGNHVRIPNARVYKATIVNYTRNPLRRFEFSVGVDTELDLSRPRQLALDTLASFTAVLKDPAPICLVDALGDSSVILVIRGWVDQRQDDFLKTRSEAQRLIKEAFDNDGIIMPEPIYNVNLRRGRVSKPPGKPVPEGGKVAARPKNIDTVRDDAVEDQMRAEVTDGKNNLLDSSAPIE